LWASRHTIPSSKVSGFQNDAPIEAIASAAPGLVASARRSSTSSSVTSSWFTTITEMNARIASRLGDEANSISRFTPSVGSGEVSERFSPPGPISTSRPTRLGFSIANRAAVPPPRLLPSRCTRSRPSSSRNAFR